MPLYDEDRDQLFELAKKNVCLECGGGLEVLYDLTKHSPMLVCKADQKHQGIKRPYEPTPFERDGYGAFNIQARRRMMTQEFGEKTKALEKYIGSVSLTKPEAREILRTIYPEAPEVEMARAILLCASYHLNPLMGHVFLIKFNKWNKDHTEIIGEEWATVLGIKAKRLLGSRRGDFSYVDNTPRVMTEEEQRTIFGEVVTDKLRVITKLQDPQTSAEAVGYGFWLIKDKVYGTDKGNSAFNMASIRSESQALDRLRPGEMPQGVQVIDEQYAPGEAIEGEKVANASPAAESVEGEGFSITLDWLNENLKLINWSHETAKTWLSKFGIDIRGTLPEVLKRCSQEQAHEFVEEIQARVARKQPELF